MFYKSCSSTIYKPDCIDCYNKKRREVYRLKRRKKRQPIAQHTITKEIIDFLDKIDKNRGYIDDVDVYRLVSYYIDIFDKVIDYMELETELIYCYNKLLEEREKI